MKNENFDRGILGKIIIEGNKKIIDLMITGFQFEMKAEMVGVTKDEIIEFINEIEKKSIDLWEATNGKVVKHKENGEILATTKINYIDREAIDNIVSINKVTKEILEITGVEPTTSILETYLKIIKIKIENMSDMLDNAQKTI